MSGIFRPPLLTRWRIGLALVLAVAADGFQFLLGPLGWVVVDEGIDVVCLAMMTALLGFHPLFLPTFIAEFIPVFDLLPTWTGCVVAVIALRRRQQRAPIPPIAPPVPGRGEVIDV